MSRFNTFLHQTGERLALPRATRSMILVEIAADLEELFQYYLDQGMTEEEAAARAEEKVDMSDEALIELVRIHSETRGWPERVFRVAHSIWERLAMGLIVLSLFAAAMLETRPVIHTTSFIWPIAGILVLSVCVFVVQMSRLSHHPNPRRLRQNLVTPLFLGAASVVAGSVGVGIDVYGALMKMATRPEAAGPIFAKAFLENTATMTVALMVALLSAIFWFVLSGRVNRIEDEAARSLLEVK